MGHKTFTVVIRKPDEPTQVLDIRFQRHAMHGRDCAFYKVYLGDRMLGTASNLGYGGWTATSYRDFDKMTEAQWKNANKTMARLGHELLELPPEGFRVPDRMRVAEGFGTRRAVAEYLVRHWDFRNENEDD